ncbi:coenzyme F420 biosynthesis associated uncharacterized protein [Allocatelliglobosispora scoriae]|uniref:Coenzyme F420 biosynthesis associated uncharacterized protein n=1 Tax=Allocatelliglobosispora scoriae TaxID=643052 RepID=A0A841BQ94_9ACTN|nr:zinc-dependent metalloprotease [Allocatelliglobosispora scoriae]MBB5871237.1 coenzyme F420 biosynthesis associated uncharacterized protein [Allocatelliglobosispora scoriae]
MAQLVDWELAAATAAKLGPTGPKVTPGEAASAVADLRRLADEATGHVAAFTGLTEAMTPGPVRVVDRRDWAAANVAGLQAVVNPLADRLTKGKEVPGLLDSVGSKVTGVQAGTVLGYLSGKVLGQYEVFSAEPGQLLLVAPNIVGVERKLGADPRDFRLWVCLHEVTHRVQFTAVPWLRSHFLAEVQAFVDASETNSQQFVTRAREALGTIADAIRDPKSTVSMIDVVQTPESKAVLDRLTALMTLVEGHAEVVMDGVGPQVIPSVGAIRESFNRRRAAGGSVESVIRRLLGIDAKLRQYAEGRHFVQTVVDRVGMPAFNTIWTSPETLPTIAELAAPEAWISRVAH